MFSAECQGDMTIPADRLVSCKRLLQFFERDFIPLHGLELLIHESRRMFVPVDFSDGPVARNARLAGVPVIHDGLNEAPVRVALDLRETILATIFFLGPTRAGTQLEMRSAGGGLDSDFPGGDTDGGVPVCLRTGDDSLAAVFPVGA
jgi:hypothetical protein